MNGDLPSLSLRISIYRLFRRTRVGQRSHLASIIFASEIAAVNRLFPNSPPFASGSRWCLLPDAGEPRMGMKSSGKANQYGDRHEPIRRYANRTQNGDKQHKQQQRS
jgi:hypothetical protein